MSSKWRLRIRLGRAMIGNVDYLGLRSEPRGVRRSKTWGENQAVRNRKLRSGATQVHEKYHKRPIFFLGMGVSINVPRDVTVYRTYNGETILSVLSVCGSETKDKFVNAAFKQSMAVNGVSWCARVDSRMKFFTSNFPIHGTARFFFLFFQSIFFFF